MEQATINNGARELPRYRCHKEVHALKIKKLMPSPEPDFVGPVCRGSVRLGSACGHCERCKWRQDNPDSALIIFPEDPRYSAFPVDAAYVRKHNPQPGGYYVVYENGYVSFSPAPAFESGYTLIEP